MAINDFKWYPERKKWSVIYLFYIQTDSRRSTQYHIIPLGLSVTLRYIKLRKILKYPPLNPEPILSYELQGMNKPNFRVARLL